jgi:acyl-CoA synthetase (NDP forming)
MSPHNRAADARSASMNRLLRPRSVAIVGASAKAGSLGEAVLRNLEQAQFSGELFLVNPKAAEIRGRACLASVEELPHGVDCAVLAIPRAGVIDAVAVCARLGVGSVIIFSAGFAESGPDGRAEQERMARIARDHHMIIEGPNCLGLINGVDGIPLTFVLTPPEKLEAEKGLAVVSQSGAMAAVLGASLRSPGLRISYSISTGNEATTSVEDFVDYLIDDEHTHVIAMIVELFRQPRRFLELVHRARSENKHIVLLHPGRTSAARESAATHTGALAGNYDVMRTLVAHAGVIIVDTIEELIDVSHILIRCASVPRGGTVVFTESGAHKALALDFCQDVGLPLPELTSQTAENLRKILPDFIPPSNPLDITAQPLAEPELYQRTIPVLLSDEGFGSIVLAIILTDDATSRFKFPHLLNAIRAMGSAKPVIFTPMNEGAPISRADVEELRTLGAALIPSPERAFRALAHLATLAKGGGTQDSLAVGESFPVDLSPGVIPEYRSKEVLAAVGIAIPAGALARTREDAQRIASEIGYPVVLKAQSRDLSHKSDVGGVVLNVDSPDAVSVAWNRLHADLARAMPALRLDGVLVERMAAKGVELIVGGRNDPEWGPVVLVGLGGVLAEALHDVRLLPPDLSVDAITNELHQLKGAALLRGFRGAPALDVRAAAEIVQGVGRLLRSAPSINEIDINPVVVYPARQGALALDALIATGVADTP